MIIFSKYMVNKTFTTARFHYYLHDSASLSIRLTFSVITRTYYYKILCKCYCII